MIDQYLWGTCERISPEAPVQVVNVDNEEYIAWWRRKCCQ